MKKFFTLNLWPPEEMRKKKEYLAKQQGKDNGGGNVVVDGVDGQDPDAGRRVFGIRNYLHQFYFLSSPVVEEIIDGSGTYGGKGAAGAWYLLPPPPAQRMGLYVCRVMTLLGLLLLLGGAVGIVVGYCWPHRGAGDLEQSLMRIAIDQDEEGNFYIPPERLADLLRDPMHGVKLASFCTFAVGASIMALSLLVPTFAQCAGGSRLAAFASEDNTPNEAPVRIYPAAGGRGFRVSPTKPTSGHKISPTSGPVPVMEELAKVQPGGGKKSASPIGGSPTPTADEMLGGIGIGMGGGGRDGSPLLQRR